MADNDIGKKSDSLYRDFMHKWYWRVRQDCREVPEGPLQRISLHNDTVLHMAAQSKERYLLLDLLKLLPEDANNPLSDIKNNDGNTILHEVATSDTMIDVAKELLRRNENLLFACNDLGEKPIFCAARYGQTKMFKFLANKMGLERQSSEESKDHLKRNDRTTVLHISIASECFGLASYIAKGYPYLIKEKDQFSMTALQYMACNPTIFRRGRTQRWRGLIEQPSKSNTDKKGFKELIVDQGFIVMNFVEEMCSGEMCSEEICLEEMCSEAKCLEAVRSEAKKIKDDRESVESLSIELIKNDTSWHASINFQAVSKDESKKDFQGVSKDESKMASEIEEDSSKLPQKKERQNSEESSTSKYKLSNESPLFFATISNIKEIINLILEFKPQTITQTNKEGMNILQVAILYRHIDIFDMVVKYEVLARKLLSVTDKEGNSILHMVSQKRKGQASEKMQNPALQLQGELLLFEKVKSASKMLVNNPLNNDKKTAEELFAASNAKLHQEAKEWLMRTTENCTILSVFIATVAFAAAYTVPGGPEQDTGIPILHSNPFFVVFVIADVISLTLALTSVGIFLSILTSSFLLEDFKTYLFKKLKQGIICLVLSVSMMAVAFGATIVLIMKHNEKTVLWDVVAFLPVPIFFLSYSPLCSTILGSWREWFMTFVGIAVKVLFFAVKVLFYAVLICFIILDRAFKGLGWTLEKACALICKTVVKGLGWTLEKACAFICKTVARISWKKSQPQSHAQSP